MATKARNFKFVRDLGLKSLSCIAYDADQTPKTNGLDVKIYKGYMAEDCTKPNATEPIVQDIVTDMFMRACGEEVTVEFVDQHHPRLTKFLRDKGLIPPLAGNK